MSLCLKFLLRVLSILTKVLAISEFSYDRERNRLVGSHFWHGYMKISHRVFIWPLTLCMFLYVIADRATSELTFRLIVLRLSVAINIARLMAIGIMGWRYRRDLCQLLNRFLRLEDMHRQLFGRGVQVPWYNLMLHLIRELCLLHFFTPPSLWIPGSMELMSCRVSILFYLLDVSMLVHLNFIKSLAAHLDEPSDNRRIQRSLCVEYFEQLLQLNHDLQQFSWIAITVRLGVDIMFNMITSLAAFWNPFIFRPLHYLFEVFFVALSLSNMLRVLKMAQCIRRMENQILDRLYLDELLRLLRYPTSIRQRRLEKLERFHLMRCTLKERSSSIHNYIYVRRSLILELMDFVFVNVILVISFSLKYQRSKRDFTKPYSLFSAGKT